VHFAKSEQVGNEPIDSRTNIDMHHWPGGVDPLRGPDVLMEVVRVNLAGASEPIG
jgi:hypothetical protein